MDYAYDIVLINYNQNQHHIKRQVKVQTCLLNDDFTETKKVLSTEYWIGASMGYNEEAVRSNYRAPSTQYSPTFQACFSMRKTSAVSPQQPVLRRLDLIGLPYRLGAHPERHKAADCLTLSKYVLGTYGIETPEADRSWYRRLRKRDYSIFREQLELWGTQATDIGVGTVALCEGIDSLCLATYIDDFPGWLSFIGTEVVWNPLEALNIVDIYCPGNNRSAITLSISAEEYFEYYELVYQHRKEEQGRELVPDIRNETATVIAVVSLVIGLASTAVGF